MDGPLPVTSRRESFLPLFFGDFLAATAEWSGEERALYLLLLGYSWSLGSIPADVEKTLRLSGWDRKAFMKCWPTVSGKFKESDGRLLNSRLEEHRAHSHEVGKRRAEAGSKGGSKRVANLKQLPSNCQANATFLLKHQSINDSEELRSSAADAATPAKPDPRKQIFDLGKSILGASSGGLISAAISRVGESEVGKVLGQMALKPTADPKAYFVAATTPKERAFVC